MTDDPPSECNARTLRSIAAALGCTVHDFTGPKGARSDLVETHELLTLWGRIGTEEGRRIALRVIREVVHTEQDDRAVAP